MFIRQLSYLLALETHRHFGRAAASCNVSQPALSTAVREMENELGITIVIRNRMFKGFTPDGERVIAWARQAQASLHGLRQDAGLVRRAPGGHLTIGVVPTAVHAATALIEQTRRVAEGLTFDIQSLSMAELLRRLRKQELDFTITYPPSADAAYDHFPLYFERYVLLSHRSASLPRKLSWHEVATMPLALLSQDMQSRRMLDEIFISAGTSVKPVVQSNAVRVLHEEVASARCCSVIPLGALPPDLSRREMEVHTIEPGHEAPIAIMRLRRDQQSALSDLTWGITKGLDFQAAFDRTLRECA